MCHGDLCAAALPMPPTPLRLPLPLQSMATAVATAIAQTAGSVKGGPGCVGQANATASAQASALAEAYAKVSLGLAPQLASCLPWLGGLAIGRCVCMACQQGAPRSTSPALQLGRATHAPPSRRCQPRAARTRPQPAPPPRACRRRLPMWVQACQAARQGRMERAALGACQLGSASQGTVGRKTPPLHPSLQAGRRKGIYSSGGGGRQRGCHRQRNRHIHP